ncbi:MAG: signal recognition particle-docking protein FtsY [Acidobacteria bacterium]|nr:MAG: signal recognition particle-docking protein FtsY [Acidobacteriota bacterium]
MSIFNYKERPGYFSRLKEALKSTTEDISRKIDVVMGTSESPITEAQLDDLEAILIGADLGVDTTTGVIEKIREETRGSGFLTSSKVKRMIREELIKILGGDIDWDEENLAKGRPYVVLVVGVNGVGKTTTIGKLAHRYNKQGKKVIIAASDTFRAAAVEQLEIWSQRTSTEIVRQAQGTDPAAVLFDSIAAAKARGKDVLIADTAGRLHTKANLMQELDKMRRIAGREVPGAPHEVFLIIDATTGQNGLIQARQFLNISGVTGLIITKLDGTAKGGIVVAIAKELKIPIRYVGVGEKKEDLMRFSAEAFVDGLFAETTRV